MDTVYMILLLAMVCVGFAMWLTRSSNLYEEQQKQWDANEDLQSAEKNVRLDCMGGRIDDSPWENESY